MIFCSFVNFLDHCITASCIMFNYTILSEHLTFFRNALDFSILLKATLGSWKSENLFDGIYLIHSQALTLFKMGDEKAPHTSFFPVTLKT